MAANMFVEISDITGDAMETGHKDWIVVQSASWNVERAVEMTDLGSTQRMHANSNFGKVELSSQMGKASNDLALSVANGTVRKEIIMHWGRSGDSAADVSYLTRIQSVIQEAGLPQTIHYLVGLMPSEMSAALNVAPENTAAVFGLYTRDKTGQQLRTGEVVSAVRSQTDIPLFGLFVSTLNSGIAGVNVTSPAAYAKRAADLTLALLFDDTPPTNLEIPTSFFKIKVFNTIFNQFK